MRHVANPRGKQIRRNPNARVLVPFHKKPRLGLEEMRIGKVSRRNSQMFDPRQLADALGEFEFQRFDRRRESC